MRGIFRPADRVHRALTTTPTPRDWLEALLAFVVIATLVGPLGFSTGLLTYDPRPLSVLPLLAIQIFFIPALGEELFFRGALIPDRTETPRAVWSIAISTVIFILWHVVETLFMPRAAALFLRPDFLFEAGLTGLCCAILRRRSGSLWTAVAVHWAVVIAWQQWLGGPGFAALR